MIPCLIAFVLALGAGAAFTAAIRRVALRFELFDQARSSRKIHSRPVPRLGGIAIVLAVLGPLCLLRLFSPAAERFFLAQPGLVVGLLGGGVAIALLGLYDDLVGAGARLKFSVQLLVALALYGLGFRIEVIANPFGAALQLGLMSLPITVLWMVGVINALNLIDGLDGLAAGVAFFGAATNLVLAAARGDVLVCLLMAAIGGALLGFLFFNFNPASIFMGDTGSMFLGFVLAAVSIKTSIKTGTAVALLVPVIALGLPIADTLLAIGRRTLAGRPVFSADKEHIHHRLMSRLVLSQRRAVLLLYGACGLFGLAALALAFANGAQSAFLLAVISTAGFLVMRKLGYLSFNGGEVGRTRRRNLLLRGRVREAEADFRVAASPEALWAALQPVLEAVGPCGARLRIERLHGEVREAIQFERAVALSGPRLPLRLELSHHDRRCGELFIEWGDGRTEVRRDEELALELLADGIAERLHRLPERPSEGAKVIALRR